MKNDPIHQLIPVILIHFPSGILKIIRRHLGLLIRKSLKLLQQCLTICVILDNNIAGSILDLHLLYARKSHQIILKCVCL